MPRLRIKLRGSRGPRESVALALTLGKLEREIMAILWKAADALRVRDICRRLGDRLAYTTVETTVERLYKKGLLARRSEERAFAYKPRVSPEEFERLVVTAVVSGFLERSPEVTIACIVDAVSHAELLDELKRVIKQARVNGLNLPRPK